LTGTCAYSTLAQIDRLLSIYAGLDSLQYHWKEFSAMIRAEVTVNPYHVLGEIDPLFYGQYIESLDPPAKPIYGGVCDENGVLRQDVICDLQEMNVPVIRWGGNYMDLYHWQDGIGPREARPPYYNYQWEGYESNQFGTHEFLDLCEQLNAIPYINLNLGTGTLQEALAWVEYCNFAGDTSFTRLRRQNGRAIYPFTCMGTRISAPKIIMSVWLAPRFSLKNSLSHASPKISAAMAKDRSELSWMSGTCATSLTVKSTAPARAAWKMPSFRLGF
jgi:hypothetical protein